MRHGPIARVHRNSVLHRLAVVVAALGLAACLSVQPAEAVHVRSRVAQHLSGRGVLLRGGGDSFAALWLNDLAGLVRLRFNIAVQFAVASSIHQAIAEFEKGQLDFVASSAGSGLTRKEFPAPSRYAAMPLFGDALCLDYNLGHRIRHTPALRLDARAIMRIFSGQTTRWNAPALSSLNPGLSLPSAPIRVFSRSDRSSENYVLSDYVSTLLPNGWKRFALALGVTAHPSSSWPVDAGHRIGGYDFREFEPQAGADNASYAVAAHRDSITIVPSAFALEHGDRCARIRNAAGRFRSPTTTNTTAALRGGRAVVAGPRHLRAAFLNRRPRAYPLSLFEAVLLPTRDISHRRGHTLAEVFRYEICSFSLAPRTFGFAPVGASLRRAAKAAVEQIPGAPPWRRCYGSRSG